MHKIALLIILTSLSCAQLPKVPQHDKYGIHANINPPGFYGVNNETHARTYRPFNDPAMKGGQCLTADHYRAFESWVQSVKTWGEQHCQ